MIISHEHQFIFIHVPKTGGTSISTVLRDHGVYLETDGLKHAGLEVVAARFGWDVVDEYFVFGFVRHPVDRLVSLYHYYAKIGVIGVDMTFEEFLRNEQEIPAKQSIMLRSQKKQSVDFVGRFEELDRDFALVCEHLGLPLKRLHQHNRTFHEPWQTYMSVPVEELVWNKHHQEFEDFGYSMHV